MYTFSKDFNNILLGALKTPEITFKINAFINKIKIN